MRPEEAFSPAAAEAHAPARNRPRKAPNAFRTISEVADELHIPQHVLRFWETKFPQVRPLKRGGGRRYYRPDDISLLRRISDLLYIQGYTIKGVQRLLREGDGRLADDIPPPPAEERAGPPEQLPPLEPAPPIPPPAPRAPRTLLGGPAPMAPEWLLAQENAGLREMLGRVLRALEEMRRRLA